MKIILTAVDPRLAEWWGKLCGDLDFVSVEEGSILDVECDAVVSPANSFGFMDGGIDGLYLDHFGPDIQLRVRKRILEGHDGELLVGMADIVETGNDTIPYLIAAPTMRVPMILRDTVNPYLAARAVFRLILQGRFPDGPRKGKPIRDVVQRVAFPGMATGVGRVSPAICARQMRRAIDDAVLDKFTFPRSWAEASEQHQLLYTDHPTRLQY